MVAQIPQKGPSPSNQEALLEARPRWVQTILPAVESVVVVASFISVQEPPQSELGSGLAIGLLASPCRSQGGPPRPPSCGTWPAWILHPSGCPPQPAQPDRPQGPCSAPGGWLPPGPAP